MTMKRGILCFALFLVYGACRPAFAVASTCATANSAESTEAKAAPPGKAIQNTIELNDYLTVLNIREPAEKAARMEAFADQYPDSVMFADALEVALQGYQQSGNLKKAAAVGKRILQIDQYHVHSLSVIAYQADIQGKAKEAAEYAERGLKALAGWTKPPGMSNQDFSRTCALTAQALYRVGGSSALGSKDYKKARDYLMKVYMIGGADLQAVYQLALSELEMQPMDIHGFWYLAKALGLARAQKNSAGVQQIEAYGRAKYKKYHGSDEGWDGLMAGAEACGDPPQFREGNIVFHGVPASITSATGDGALHGVPSSVSSPTGDGRMHGVAASVSSPTPDGRLHGVAASVTSPQGNPTVSVQREGRPCEGVAFSDVPGAAGSIDRPSREANADAMIPRNFLRSIKREPTPQELACRIVQEPDFNSLSIDDKELVLSFRDAAPCNREAADKVWAALLNAAGGGRAKFRFNGVKVISAGGDFLDVALNEERQKDNRADIHLRLDRPMVAPPQPGEIVDIIGVLTSYTPNPFLFSMEQGELEGRTKAAAKPGSQTVRR